MEALSPFQRSRHSLESTFQRVRASVITGLFIRIDVDKSSSHQLSHPEIASDNPCGC